MAAESDESSTGRAVLIFFAVLALYVLSFGPVCRYSAKTMLRSAPITFGYSGAAPRYPAWVQTVYFPLSWAAMHCRPIHEALAWYCGGAFILFMGGR